MDLEHYISKQTLVEEAKLILRTILERRQGGRGASIHDTRKLVENSISLRITEYIRFLEKYGYILYNRKSNMADVTKEGELVALGEKIDGLEGDVTYHFEDRIQKAEEVVEAQVVEDVAENIDNRYLRYGAMGVGGIGTVYRARHISLNREVAIKEIKDLFNYFNDFQKEEIIRRLKDEVRRHALLIHPNVIQILDQNCEREAPYFVMELAPCGNLRGIMDSVEGRVPIKVALKYFLQIAYALRFAHGKGLVHRNLKPENVLIDEHGNAKVADFCVSRIVERDSRIITQVYVGVGSVGYMAPEQFRDVSQVGPQSDVYSLGILLYELLTRVLPGRRSPMPSSYHDDIPPDLDDIFDKMTVDQLDQRYATVDEVLQDFYGADDILDILDKRSAVLFVDHPLPPRAPEPAPEPVPEPAHEEAPPEAAAAPLEDEGRWEDDDEEFLLSAPPPSEEPASPPEDEYPPPREELPRFEDPPAEPEPPPKAPEPPPKAPERPRGLDLSLGHRSHSVSYSRLRNEPQAKPKPRPEPGLPRERKRHGEGSLFQEATSSHKVSDLEAEEIEVDDVEYDEEDL